MKKAILLFSIFSMMSGIALAQDEYDDIYYNPKSEKSTVTSTKQTNSTKQNKKQPKYIKDFGSMDVDQYNRRGQYYMSPVDTIGTSAEQGSDFVYTQQIQKYYNPTIVVDNAGTLQDILNNSYGNVEIVYNDYGNPVFMPSYGYPYNRWSYWYDSWDPYWSWNWGSSWNWSWSWGPSWSWNWGPSWAWNWGPSWGWGPTWGPAWGWGPSWSWGPSWGPGWGPSWGHGGHWADYRPNGNRPNRPGQGWASNTQPGYNRPYSGMSGSGSHNGFQGGNAMNHHRTYGGSRTSSSQDRVNSSQGNSYGGNRGYTINSNGHRTYNNSSNSVTTNSNRTTNNMNSTTNSNRSYNYNSRSTTNSNRSYNSSGSGRSYNSGGGSRSTGGSGSRGRHR